MRMVAGVRRAERQSGETLRPAPGDELSYLGHSLQHKEATGIPCLADEEERSVVLIPGDVVNVVGLFDA